MQEPEQTDAYNSTTNQPLELSTSRQFTAWLWEQNISLSFTTYQVGKFFFIGLQQDGKLEVFQRNFDRCMGLCVDGSSLYLSSLYQIWRFENILPTGENYNGYDALYVPQMSYITGDLDVHDLVVDESGKLVFVNTLFGCLGTVSDRASFIPVWQPPFISRLAAEDRCHLNGLALRDKKPRYVTAVSQTDIADGWREKRRDGGVAIDITTNEIIYQGMSMPHSPRWYQEKLWILNSGHGDFGYINTETGEWHSVAFCPGYLRGLAFHGHFAIVGLSKPRNKTFSGLPLNEKLQDKDVEARCGLFVIDLRTGDIVHWLRLEGLVSELYDVIVIPSVRRPMSIGLKTDEIRRVVTIGS